MATDYSKLKVVDLKAELKRRGLAQAGRKDELITRLEEADAAPQEEQAQDTEPQADPDNSEPASTEPIDAPVAEDRTSDDPGSASQEPLPADQVTTPKASALPLETSTSSQAPSQAPSTSAEPERTSSTELNLDSQKRKRRSASPPPSGHDTPRKRARASGESISEEAQSSLPAQLGEAEDRKIAALNGVAKDHHAAEQEDALDYGASSPAEHDQAREVTPTPADYAMTGTRDLPSPEPPQSSAMELERDVEPAIHPATSALYIKNFMRPLQKPLVEQYLVDLASPAGATPDPDVIVDFFLDTIRTHALVRFKSVSAASRVRTALHDVVWPDERNRKPLWADFVPPDEIRGWVDRETSGGGGGRNSSRWEVVYETDGDGGVVAVLQEAGLQDARAPARPPTGPAAGKTVDIPTGPSRSYPGIEAAPSGPRGYLERGRGAPPGRPGQQTGAGDRTTRAYPPLTYQPVSAEVAKRRVDNIHSFVSRDPDRRVGREKNRYTFEMGDSFVDRGKEVFEGIRPPHRERERRAGFQGGGGGGGGGRRGPPPPRGFGRGPGSRYDDYRPPPRRYDQYRGGDERDSYRDRRY